MRSTDDSVAQIAEKTGFGNSVFFGKFVKKHSGMTPLHLRSYRLSAANSACQIAQNALNDTYIHAPFSGVISRNFVDAGSSVTPAVPVVKLVEISPFKASTAEAEKEIDDFEKGMLAEISVDALNGETFEGTIVEKGVATDPLSRTYDVKFICKNPDGKLQPGMLCSVEKKGEDGEKGIVVQVE